MRRVRSASIGIWLGRQWRGGVTVRSQRADPRVVADEPLPAYAGRGPQAPVVHVVNLSVSGAAVLAAKPLGDVGDPVLLRLEASEADAAAELVLSGRIRYVIGERGRREDAAWLHGTRFEALPEEARAFLERFVNERLEAGSGAE